MSLSIASNNRGRGLLQLTGKDDYRDFGKAVGVDLVACPDLVADQEYAAMAAAWEWDRSKLNPIADAADFEKVTRVINGGLNGFAERKRLYSMALEALRDKEA